MEAPSARGMHCAVGIASSMEKGAAQLEARIRTPANVVHAYFTHCAEAHPNLPSKAYLFLFFHLFFHINWFVYLYNI